MELDSQYASEVRDKLGFFPVWPPGDQVAPGDVGVLRRGVFRRAGALDDLIAGIDLRIARQITDRPTRFRSSGCSAGEVHAAGGAPVSTGVDLNAEMTLTFGAQGGVAFDAEQCEEITIANMLKVSSAIDAQRNSWKSGYVLVSRVTVAQRYTVIISGATNASVVLSGAANALKQWNLAKAGVSSSEANEGGYERSGSGPILLGLYGFDWMFNLGGGSLQPLGLVDDEAGPGPAFIELPPRNALFDRE